MLQTTKRNARIITLDAMVAGTGCNRRQGVDLKLKLIENSVRIPKRECRQQAQHGQQLHPILHSLPSPFPVANFSLLCRFSLLTFDAELCPPCSGANQVQFFCFFFFLERTLTAPGNKLNYA